MLIVNFDNVKFHYGAQPVLKSVSFQIDSRQKLGLIGTNGSGKTSILRLLLGQEPPTSGSVSIASGARIGYIPQYVEYEADQTVMNFLLAEYNSLTEELREKESLLSNNAEANLRTALRRYQGARDAYDRIEGDHFPQRAEAMISALGLAGREDQKIESLSGGEKNVLSLAHALLTEPDLLLLDEPANHLDYLGVAWLEDFLSNRFKGAVLMVSHNRYLLDRVVKGVLDLEDGRVRMYDGGYSEYRMEKLRRLMSQQRDFVVNQRRLGQLEELVRRFEQKARSTGDSKWGKRLRARKSQLERERREAVDKPVLNESSISARFSSEAPRASIALQVRGYSKSFGELCLLEHSDLDIAGGERVALVGPNGSGKTTLLRDIVRHGDWARKDIRIGPSMRVGYSSQEQEVMKDNHTIIEEILAAAPADRTMSSHDAFAVLTRFMFSHEDMNKRVAHLSGGERNRMQLARLIVQRANFLILDEPTNHLDILAREAVEEALEDFQGTLLIVSHDRYFLDKVVNRVVEIRDRSLISYDGNFTDFWRTRQSLMPKVAGRISSRENLRKQVRTERATSRNEVASLQRSVLESEAKKLELEKRLADAFRRGDTRDGRRLQRQLTRATDHLQDSYDRWFRESEG